MLCLLRSGEMINYHQMALFSVSFVEHMFMQFYPCQ
jgi:hypothetical protein